MSKVYYSFIPTEYKIKKAYPQSRQVDIDSTSNEKLKIQKSAVWELLAYGIKDYTKKDISSFEIEKQENGKWVVDGFNFSLSHSNNAVAVAISDCPIGIDIEGLDNKKLSNDFITKMLTENEKNTIGYSNEINRVSLWTKKESIYKINGKGLFKPQEIDTTKYNSKTRIVLNNSFVISVSTLQNQKIHFCEIKL